MEVEECLQLTLSGEVLINIQVNPGSNKSGPIGYDQWTKRLKLAVRAKAEGGKANNAVIYTLSELLKVPKRDLDIVTGHKSRTKQIKVSNQDIQLIKKALKYSIK